MNRAGPWARDEELAASLSAREQEGILLVPWRAWPEAWTPEPNACHANAGRWIAEHDGWAVVRGWVLEYGSPGAEAAYVSHSVVADPAGRLLEVTMNDQVTRRLLEHLGDMHVFAERVTSQAVGHRTRVSPRVDRLELVDRLTASSTP